MDFELKCEPCKQKQRELVRLFSQSISPEEKYQRIIEMGKEQQKLLPEEKNPDRLVKGCQSQMYLKLWISQGRVYFQTESDALISAGLGELVRRVYSGEPIEVVLGCPPTYIEEIGLANQLSFSRINGLSALLAKIKSEIVTLMTQEKQVL